jgi:hypothetical protein
VLNPHPTRYAGLNGVLHDLVVGAVDALGESFVGAYLQGSFALGAGDLHSDCDFVVVVRHRPDPVQEAALRRLHADLPHREGCWNRRLEGSYAVAADLVSTEGLGRTWLHVGRGSDRMEWSTHCNQPWTRWILRRHGITLLGPCPVELVGEVPADVLREHARAALATLTDDVLGRCPSGVAWCQRHLVVQASRSFHTVRTGQVASPRDALRWTMVHGDPAWRPLLQQVLADRDLGLDPQAPPRPGAMQAARDFAAYVAAVA